MASLPCVQRNPGSSLRRSKPRASAPGHRYMPAMPPLMLLQNIHITLGSAPLLAGAELDKAILKEAATGKY